MIIDVDSHFMEPIDWLEQVEPELASDLARSRRAKEAAAAASDGPKTALLDKPSPPLPWDHVQGAQGGQARDDLCRDVGIDLQFILPSRSLQRVQQAARVSPSLGRSAIDALNRWTLSVTSDWPRLSPATIVDFEDVEFTIGQLERGRAAGSRVMYLEPLPIGERSLAHADFDRIWQAVCSLGMVAMFHYGAGPMPYWDKRWLNNGRWDISDPELFTFMNVHTLPEFAIEALIFGRVFERFPGLRVMCSEFTVEWLPVWLRRFDRLHRDFPLKVMGARRSRLSEHPREAARRCVRVTPVFDEPIARMIDEAPGMIVYSSDYPHPEGNSTWPAAATELIAAVGEEARAAYLGRTVAADLGLDVAALASS